jgi:hypothetical protein
VTDETLIADLVRAGLTDPELLQRVANLTVELSRMSAEVSGTVRHYERDRKRRYRSNKSNEDNGNSEANDAELPPANVPDVPKDVPDNHNSRCDLSSFLSSSNSLPTTESKKEVVARARGTRLTVGLPITDIDRDAALQLGMPAHKIETAWAEFVDYWIGVPGQRGTKLDWPATWRNRVRTITGRKGKDDERSLLAAADRFIDHFGGPAAARAYVPGSSGPKPLSLDFGPSAPSVRLLPKG